jgi:hypothetical protein
VQKSHGLQFDGSRFWVMHRRRAYGPFDYEWSKDFYGIELHYQGSKFGEYCSPAELFADLKPFDLPIRVAEVASIAIGCTVYGILSGWPEEERLVFLVDQLRTLGYEQFTHIGGPPNTK